MHSIPRLGLRRCAQIGRNTLRGLHIESLPQDWADPSQVRSASRDQGSAADSANKGRNVRQLGAKEELVCEKRSATQTIIHSTGKGGGLPSRPVRACRERSAHGASRQWEYLDKARWNSMD